MLFRCVLCLSLLGLVACHQDNDCHDTPDGKHKADAAHLWHDIPARDGINLNAVIEIPAGTNAKYEISKKDGVPNQEIMDGEPRTVKYISYPFNYGMIPSTLLSEEDRGDGDPLDVIVLGNALKRGSIQKVKVIGVIKLLDGGEQDDKLIAVRTDDSLWQVSSLDEMTQNFPGVDSIISIWIRNYKGPGEMKVLGWQEADSALAITQRAIDTYSLHY